MKQALITLRGRLGWASLILAVAALAVIGLAILGARSWGWDPGFALQGLTLTVAPIVALVGGVLGILALILVLVPPFGDARRAFAAVVIAVITVAGAVYARTSREAAPPIHDVATDWRDPLIFSPALMQARGSKANPVDLAPRVDPFSKGRYAGLTVAEVNAMTCPAALAVIAPETPAKAYAAAKQALARLGLKPVTDDPAMGRLEATAQSLLFHFKDDIVIRVRPEGPGARIDIRSVSRSGAADGGSNCAHVTRLRAALNP